MSKIKKYCTVPKKNSFCYTCGDCVPKDRLQDISELDESIYSKYFNSQIDRKAKWVPSKICISCKLNLSNWWLNKQKSMPFGVPMQWIEPKNHDKTTCYFCLNYQGFGFNRFRKKKITYQNGSFAIRPLPHDESHPIPENENSENDESGESIEDVNIEDANDPDFLPTNSKLITESHLNQIVRKLHLSQRHAEILASELKSVNVLAPGVKVTGFRHRQEQFKPYFTLSDDKSYAYCHDIASLMLEMNISYFDPDEWRIFIDSSKSSLKAVLLYQDSTIKPVPILYAVGKKEDYYTMKWVLDTVYYQKYMWRACCDLKVLTLLAGMQTGYTKYCCVFCYFDSRNKNLYEQRYWPQRKNATLGQFNVIHPALIEMKKIMMAPLHMKLGLMKNYLKALIRQIVIDPDTKQKIPKNQRVFDFLRTEAFPGLSLDKIKEGERLYFCIFKLHNLTKRNNIFSAVLNGPDIRKLMTQMNDAFVACLDDDEKDAWNKLKAVIDGLLGSRRAENYVVSF